jgi:formylglycine-generating enzyme required for sulfatase activity
MSSTLDQQTFRDIVNLLIPHCADPASRKSLATTALYGCRVLDQLDYSGNARDYVVHLATTLLAFGECHQDQPAIIALLEQVKHEVGVGQQEQINNLIASIPTGVIVVTYDDWQTFQNNSGTHVFISYSRENLPDVRRITTDLLNAGLNVWIDQAGLKAGTADWEQALRDAIEGASAVLFMASPTARRSAYVRDELAIAQAKNRAIYPVWVAGEERTDCVPMGLGYVQLVDVRGSSYAAGLQKLIEALQSEQLSMPKTEESKPVVDTSKPPRNPYKGLQAFRADDEADFFGRDTLIEELVVKLGNGVKPPRLLVVLGASGSGKSSVVMAGLLPRLQKGAIKGSENWLYLNPIVPGNNPIEGLTIVLARLMKDKSQTAIREDLMNHNKRGLHALTRELSDKPVVLYIDQFEELFTLVNDEAERRQVIDLLSTAITGPNGILTVILSMRADFYDRPMQYAEFGGLIESHHVAVKLMSLADLYDVVQKPAQQAGLIFDEGLVTEMVFTVREEVAALPLLQFTLDQLFEKRDGRTLTLQAYEEMGGVQGALAQHAEATFDNLPSEQHKTLARALFLRLIEAGATEQDTTRRRATGSELTLTDATATRILQETANAFVDARLLVTDQSGDERTMEVSHEALIREWKRLGTWLHEAREDLRLQKTLPTTVAEWLRRNHPEAMLYHGTVLQEAQSWAERNIASRDETLFLHESAKAEAERKRIEEWTKRRMRQLGFSLMGVIVVALLGLLVFVGQNTTRLQSEAATLQFQALHNQVQADWIATRASGMGVGGFPPSGLTQTPAVAFFATATMQAAQVQWTPTEQVFDNVAMVLVPAGCFWMGSLTTDNEHPVHEVCFDAPFWIDRYEVTNEQFAQFDGKAERESEYCDLNLDNIITTDERATCTELPRSSVAWVEARDYCQVSRGVRLPTEAEWEYAARGPNSLVYPWGNTFEGDNVVYHANSSVLPDIVGSRQGGVSWVGAYDMSGNVWEWTNTIYDNAQFTREFPYPYATDDGREDNKTDVYFIRVMRGGSFQVGEFGLRSAYRYPSGSIEHINGFRCARSYE